MTGNVLAFAAAPGSAQTVITRSAIGGGVGDCGVQTIRAMGFVATSAPAEDM